MDVAWMLSPHTSNDNWELRYSLRSFAANYHGSGRAWIVGARPSWLMDGCGVTHLANPTPYGDKDSNLLNHALRLALNSRVSDPFILCSDDHFLLKPSSPDDFKAYHCGSLPSTGAGNAWRKQLLRCGQILRGLGVADPKDFDGHIPYVLHKRWIANLTQLRLGHGQLTLFTALLNLAELPGAETPRIDSERVRGRIHSLSLGKKLVAKKFRENRFACLNHGTENHPQVVTELTTRFPEPAPWEQP